MQYIWKLYKWESGTNRTELTNYLTVPIFLELRCNGELSTGEVILETPTSEYPAAFPPKTKMTIERYIDGNLDAYFDYLVDHDDVEDYAGCPELCCHRVYLIAPEAFAQGLHCDNFSLTYELNDVTLKYKTVVPSDMKASPTSTDIIGTGYERPSWSYGGESYAKQGVGKAWYNFPQSGSFYYTNSFAYVWDGLDALRNLNLNLNGRVAHNISFTMPIVKCYWHNGTSVRTFLFDCPTRCNVTRTTLKNGIAVQGSKVTVATKFYNPSSVQTPTDDQVKRVMYNADGRAGLRTSKTYSYTEAVGGTDALYQAKIFRENEITNFPAIINTTDTSHSSRSVSFTTTALTAEQIAQELKYQYDIECVIEPYESGSVVSQYKIKCELVFRPEPWWRALLGQLDDLDYAYSYTSSPSKPNVNSYKAAVAFYCMDMEEDAEDTPPFLIKGRKYNCYDLFRKAMLTCDTQMFDNDDYGLDEKIDEEGTDTGIQYPIVVHPDYIIALKQTVMHESVFEDKNLWQIIQQLGYYLHAIPYLEFDRTGKERFVLKFKKLGGTETQNNDSVKLTIFNSQTLENYFTQYDSYVTNIFSPQNMIDEWLVCKTSDSNYLVSNETAELHTKYNISEIIAFDITYNGTTKSALEYIFEKTVYDTLSAKTDFTPAKWAALYYEMGTNKIMGLNYTPPTINDDGYFALKVIVGKLFNNGEYDADIKFNDLKFHITYRTQDNLRITQIRPDLENFMKTSEFEKYPHHEQFYGQQDKIVDSERFSANLWGKLIRVANGIYQCQEYAKHGQEKIPGYLVEIKGEKYYVTECENE